MDTNEQAPNKRRKLEEPYVRDTDYILKKHSGKPPSMVIHLHDGYFRFDGQEGSFAYNSPMKEVLKHLREQTVPHNMLEELLRESVPFYDGCLIVEVHKHVGAAGKNEAKSDTKTGADTVKFSMHNYTEHVTPSPLAPYPAKAKASDEGSEKTASANGEMGAPERPSKEKEKNGPKITTIVLHPTPLSRHHELLLLAQTPASELRSKKKSGDNAAPSSAQPQTPQLSVPPTPINTTHGPLSQSQKMCLEEGDYYAFQAEMLLATEPPLFLEPIKNEEDRELVLEMLQHPQLNRNKPPSPKTRKRSTAEMAADDAQAAESERRMLIMDERIKPSARAGAGATANENQSAAASLGFSRFKTIEMVRQKHDEQERVKKDDEARAAVEKRQAEEQASAQAAQQQQQLMAKQQQQQIEMMRQRQVTQRQQNLMRSQENQRQQQQIAEAHRAAQVQMAAVREHAHPQQNQMASGSQQANGFQHPASMAQNSPIVRQNTPMMNSSPMMPQNGFPMVQTNSQGAGSPQRPTSAALKNRNVAMARQASQQHGSQSNTPNLNQGTPNMAQAMPNRNMTQTPRMGPGSPAAAMQGTPTSANGMPMPTPQMNNAQMSQQMMLASIQQNQGQPMSAQDISDIRNRQQAALMQQQQQMLMRAAQQNPNNPQVQAAMMQQRAMQQRAVFQRHQIQQQMGQTGSPGGMQTPQMGHAHPQTPGGQQQQQPASQEQVLEARRRAMQMQANRSAAQQQAQQQLVHAGQAYGGWQNIPPNVLQTLPQQSQMVYNQNIQQFRQRQLMAQQAQRNMSPNGNANANNAGGGGGGQGGAQVVPGGQADPEYMNQLRQHQERLRQQQQQQLQAQQGAGASGGFPGGMAMNMNFNNGNAQQGGGGGGNGGSAPDNLSHHFAQMQNAINRGQNGGGGGGQMQ